MIIKNPDRKKIISKDTHELDQSQRKAVAKIFGGCVMNQRVAVFGVRDIEHQFLLFLSEKMLLVHSETRDCVILRRFKRGLARGGCLMPRGSFIQVQHSDAGFVGGIIL